MMANSYKLLLAGLAALTILMPWWLTVNAPQIGLFGALLLGAAFPLLLIYAVLRRIRNWSGITALVMIPYSVLGIMEVVATLGALDSGMAIAIVSIANFFTALDAGRRPS